MSLPRYEYARQWSLAASLLLLGCASAREPRIRLVDGLGACVVVEPPTLERTGENLLSVSVPLRNVAGQDLDLLVLVEFLDSAGNRYNDDTPQQAFALARGQTRAFSAVSMLSKAEDFVAHVSRCPRRGVSGR